MMNGFVSHSMIASIQHWAVARGRLLIDNAAPTTASAVK